MPAPCPVPVITASSDTQNRLYKPARLQVQCLSAARRDWTILWIKVSWTIETAFEVDPSMLPYLYRSPAIWAFRTGTKFLRKNIVKMSNNQPERSNSEWTWDIPSPPVTLHRGLWNSGWLCKASRKALFGWHPDLEFLHPTLDRWPYYMTVSGHMVPDRHCTVSCSKNSDLLVLSTPQTMVMWLQRSVFGTCGNQM